MVFGVLQALEVGVFGEAEFALMFLQPQAGKEEYLLQELQQQQAQVEYAVPMEREGVDNNVPLHVVENYVEPSGRLRQE